MCQRFADIRGQGFDQRRIVLRNQIVGVGINYILDFFTQKFLAEKFFDDRFLRHELFADRFADGRREPFAMARNHSLGKNRETEKFYRMTRTKKHSYGQPRTDISVNAGKQNQEDCFDCGSVIKIHYF